MQELLASLENQTLVSKVADYSIPPEIHTLSHLLRIEIFNKLEVGHRPPNWLLSIAKESCICKLETKAPVRRLVQSLIAMVTVNCCIWGDWHYCDNCDSVHRRQPRDLQGC